MRVAADSTNVSVIIRIVDATDGTPETGVVAATPGLALGYWREGAASFVGLTESDLATLDAAHSDGGLLHINSGYYRLDPVDAAFAAGADQVLIGGVADGMVVIGQIVEIGVTLDALNDPTAATIATAVWAETSRTLTGFGTLVADIAAAVWGYVTRTLTSGGGSGGATAQEVWEYSPRTLTQSAAQVIAAVGGSDLGIVRGVTFNATLTDLTIPAGWSEIYFSMKHTPHPSDATAAAQVRVSNPGVAGDGLLYLAGAAAADATWGSLVVGASSIAIVIADDATSLLSQGAYGYDIKALLGDGSSQLLAEGSLSIRLTETETI